MAGNQVPGLNLPQWRNLLGAKRGRVRAAGAESATRRGRNRARWVTGDDEPLATETRVGDRGGGEQSLCVRVPGVRVELRRRRMLDDDSQIHDRDLIRNVTDDAEIMADEEVREIALVAQALQELED